MRNFFLIVCLSLVFHAGYSQPKDLIDGWRAFAKVKFEPTFMEEVQQHMLVPQFDRHIKALEGMKVALKGYVMPFDYGDEPLIILSKYPYSSCFFCGAAGPESVAEVHFTGPRPSFDADELVTIVGKLRLNVEDINLMNFILEDGEVKE